MKTALKRYRRMTQQGFDQALLVDPFRDSVIARATPKSDNKSDNTSDADNTSDNRLSKNETAQTRKASRFRESRGLFLQKVTPTGLESVPKTRGKLTHPLNLT